jgi:hypothetical protein
VLGNDVTKLTSSCQLNSPSKLPASPPSTSKSPLLHTTTLKPNLPNSNLIPNTNYHTYTRKHGSWQRRKHQGLLPGQQRGLRRIRRERGACTQVEGGQEHSSHRGRRRLENLHIRVSRHLSSRGFADNVTTGTASKASSTAQATCSSRTSSEPRMRTTSLSRFWRRVMFRLLRYAYTAHPLAMRL